MSHLIPELARSINRGHQAKSLELAEAISATMRSRGESLTEAKRLLYSKVFERPIRESPDSSLEKIVNSIFYLREKYGTTAANEMIEKAPQVVALSQESIEQKSEYLKSNAGFDDDSIQSHAILLSYSMVRLASRCEYAKSRGSELAWVRMVSYYSSSDSEYIHDLQWRGMDASLKGYLEFKEKVRVRLMREASSKQKTAQKIK